MPILLRYEPSIARTETNDIFRIAEPGGFATEFFQKRASGQRAGLAGGPDAIPGLFGFGPSRAKTIS